MRMFMMKARELIGLSSWLPEDIIFERETAPKVVEILGGNLVRVRKNGKDVPAVRENDGSWRVKAVFPFSVSVNTIRRKYAELCRAFNVVYVNVGNVATRIAGHGTAVSYRVA